MTMHRASLALAAVSRDYPDCWRRLDRLLFDVRAQGVTWPEWCWAPMAASYAVVSNGGALDTSKAGDVARLAALGAWRLTQGIYRIDETLLDELWASDIDGALPTETLEHLPEWCVYVETPGRALMDSPLSGFWCHLESDSNDGHAELRFLLDLDGRMVALPLHLARGKGTLADAGIGAAKEAASQAALGGSPLIAQRLIDTGPELAAPVRPLVSLVLYLCTAAEELRTADGRQPSHPSPQPGRRNEPPRFYPADRPAIFEAGVRLGATLRAARQKADASGVGGSGAAHVGHVRRAHWHTYLHGPRDGPQRREVRWLPPILVRLDPDSVSPVIRPVKEN